jgi:tetratricopeptide (TPR) repeat protein
LLYERGKYAELLEISRNVETQKLTFAELKIVAATYLRLKDFTNAQYYLERLYRNKASDADTVNNLSYCFTQLGQHEKAYQVWRATKYNVKNNVYILNYGISLLGVGRLEEGISALMRFRRLYPKNSAYQDYISELWLQCRNLLKEEDINGWQTSESFIRFKSLPMKVMQLIDFYLKGDVRSCQKCISIIRSDEAKKYYKELNEGQKLFVSAYTNFIIKLGTKRKSCEQEIFHVGESHCLSFANEVLRIYDNDYSITPKIIMGAKAFHLGNDTKNKYKALLENNISISPQKYILFSFGEIDCRENEGIIVAASQADREQICRDTALSYVSKLVGLCETYSKYPIIFTVPIPLQQISESPTDFRNRMRLVEIFNESIFEQQKNMRFDIISLFSKYSARDKEYEGELHIDNRHLKRSAIGQATIIEPGEVEKLR